MGLRILHSADWHLGYSFASFPGEQREYLKARQEEIPRKVAGLCRRENCDMVLLSGDILDSPEERRYTKLLKQTLESCSVPVLIAPGNHDYVNRGSPWLRESWPGNVHIFTGDLTDIPFEKLDCRVWGAGYRSMDCPGLLENFRAEGPEKYRIGILHGDPLRSSSPYCPVTAAQLKDSGLGYLALGHIHKQGQFRLGRSLCGWPGAPMGLGFHEPGPKGVYIVTLDEETRIEFHSLGAPEFYDREISVEELYPLLAGTDKQAFLKITLTGENATPLEEVKERFASYPNIHWIDRRSGFADPWRRAGEESLEGLYFRLLREKLEKASEEDREIIRLAAKLSDRILTAEEVVL